MRTTFPPLPRGERIASEAPLSAFHVDVLMKVLKEGLIVVSATGLNGVAVIEKGRMTDAFSIDSSGQAHMADTALKAMISRDDAVISAAQLPADILPAIPLLWRGAARIDHLNGRYANIAQLIDDARASNTSAALEVDTAHGSAVLLIHGGTTAAYIDSHDTTCDAFLSAVQKGVLTVWLDVDVIPTAPVTGRSVLPGAALAATPSASSNGSDMQTTPVLVEKLYDIAVLHLGPYADDLKPLIEQSSSSVKGLRTAIASVDVTVFHPAIRGKVPEMITEMEQCLNGI